jgi:hypothetical protein
MLHARLTHRTVCKRPEAELGLVTASPGISFSPIPTVHQLLLSLIVLSSKIKVKADIYFLPSLPCCGSSSSTTLFSAHLDLCLGATNVTMARPMLLLSTSSHSYIFNYILQSTVLKSIQSHGNARNGRHNSHADNIHIALFCRGFRCISNRPTLRRDFYLCHSLFMKI